uniref:Lysine histidine transporter 1 n=1 Tax=Rhizophora mucronata TaxID=61149 RepID=A0A2P2JDP2_RHIMU
MDTGRVGNKDVLSIEEGGEKVKPENLDQGVTTAHTVGHDSWQQVGFLLVTGFNCGYLLSYSSLIMVPIGWTWGIIILLAVGLYTAYANWLLAAFHFIEGKRFIRYRDLMGFAFGRHFYYITWVLQFLTFLLANMGFILLGGRALKEMNLDFSNSPLRLQYFIIMAGVSYFLFSFSSPTMSAMRVWLAVSAALTCIYVTALLVEVVDDGRKNKTRNHDTTRSKVDKVFNAFAAISTVIAANTGGLLPEMQSTLRQPAVKNMRKALVSQFTLGISVYYGVTLVGYWAYGTSVSWYLPQQLTGSKWVKILINSAVFLQSVVSQNMFIAPVHEALDTRFLNVNEKMHSRANIKRLFLLRALFYTGNTFVTAALPFMGDFVTLIGSFTLVTLTFVFPSMIFLKVKRETARMEKKIWHWFNVIAFSFLALATTISAVRLIINDVQQYSFFADA